MSGWGDDTIAPLTSHSPERAPRGDLRRYPIGHFDAFKSDEVRERVVADQVAFLAEHLMPGARPSHLQGRLETQAKQEFARAG